VKANKLTASEQVAQIQKIPFLIRERKQADQTLVQTVTSLQQMAKANAQLQLSVKSRRDIRSEIDTLYREGQRISDFYQSLAKSE
jgi:hypothetical protein